MKIARERHRQKEAAELAKAAVCPKERILGPSEKAKDVENEKQSIHERLYAERQTRTERRKSLQTKFEHEFREKMALRHDAADKDEFGDGIFERLHEEKASRDQKRADLQARANEDYSVTSAVAHGWTKGLRAQSEKRDDGPSSTAAETSGPGPSGPAGRMSIHERLFREQQQIAERRRILTDKHAGGRRASCPDLTQDRIDVIPGHPDSKTKSRRSSFIPWQEPQQAMPSPGPARLAGQSQPVGCPVELLESAMLAVEEEAELMARRAPMPQPEQYLIGTPLTSPERSRDSQPSPDLLPADPVTVMGIDLKDPLLALSPPASPTAALFAEGSDADLTDEEDGDEDQDEEEQEEP